ncbi:MarR family winged helix-turn-helix transcriptional regulator [Priestia megaterium]|uniref:MarR family winged helix-turn-helix transcriptional regulator n=1 Tax=Priestia megaterium TaxID=1404 RepID=UPI00366AB02E
MSKVPFEKEMQNMIMVLHKRITVQIKEVVLSEGVTPFQYDMLLLIKSGVQVSVTELAKEMGVGLSSITPVITRLQNLNLVYRYHSEKDRRKVIMEITEKGDHIIKAINEKMDHTMKHLFSNYQEEEQEQWLVLCRKLILNR